MESTKGWPKLAGWHEDWHLGILKKHSFCNYTRLCISPQGLEVFFLNTQKTKSYTKAVIITINILLVESLEDKF